MKGFNVIARWSLGRSRKTSVIQAGVHEQLLDYINITIPSLLFIAVGLVVYEFGFKSFYINHRSINFWLRIILMITSFLVAFRILFEIFTRKKLWARMFNIAGWLFVVFLAFYLLPIKQSLVITNSNRFIIIKLVLYGGIVLGFITEVSNFLNLLYSKSINPGILFVGSFALLILIGAFLLKVPNATYGGISSIDALFTATSAVCVTGLIVVDTATHFTPFGQMILLILIQIGGLGFMTLTGLLAYAVAGNASFKTQLAFTSMTSSRKINNIMHFVYLVVVVTFVFELLGGVLIYLSVDDQLFSRKLDKAFFAVFHSISAFCNAGFSTFSYGLFESGIRFNYIMQFFIALLIILGGMGFPIVFNLYRYVSIQVNKTGRWLTGRKTKVHAQNIILINSRLALVVSAFLLLIGFVAYLLFEQQGTLAQHPTYIGKVMTAFFGSVTPRTAGFNTVDLTAMTLPMVMIYLLLMWVGASPGSTGGGIKTTTAGVALLNMAAVLRGKDRSEFYHSEISHQSVRRAFAIILSSLLIIGIAVFSICINDADKGLINIAFECFSAFSTVGLSLGITAGLTAISKMVLVLTMFIGRVGTITLLVIFIRQSKQLYYRYPKEDIAF